MEPLAQYQNYNASDFVNDTAFRAWVWQQPEAATLFWDEFIRDNPHKSPQIKQARAVVLGMTVVDGPMDAAEIEQRVQATLADIRQLPAMSPAEPDLTATPVRRLWPVRWIAAAASVVLLLGAGWLWLADGTYTNPLINRQADQPVTGIAEHTNNTSQPLRLVLSDSSVVVLRPNSQLRYVRTFTGAKREVFLTGEARFDVTRHPDRPFFVYAQNVVTKVLGTSFTVRAFADERNVQVQVKTGRVAVYADPNVPGSSRAEKKGILLTPNQQVSYNKVSNELTRTLVSKPELLTALAPSTAFVYDETPVADVLVALERAYSVPIVFDEADLSECLLTATLTNQSFYTKLDLICQTIGGRYDVVDGQVIVSSSGCR